MVELIKATDLDMDFVLNFKLKSIENVYLIKYNDEKVGVLEYTKNVNNFIEEEPEVLIHIEYVEILEQYRRKGIGTKAIEKLNIGDMDFVSGNAIPSSVGFWKSLGADFGGEDEDIDYYLDKNICLGFII